MYRLERQDQFNRLLEGLSRCVVETLRDEEIVGYAKEKWPARWVGRLGGGIRYVIYHEVYL
jgi:hypothetical protein